jgi:hypothetical protein
LGREYAVKTDQVQARTRHQRGHAAQRRCRLRTVSISLA